MRPGLLRLVSAALLTAVGSTASAEPLRLNASPVPLYRDTPSETRLGRLEFRGALDLTSPDSRFGGLSALAVRPDGGELTAFSDHGFWVVMTPEYSDGRLTGITAARFGVLVDEREFPLERRDMRDAESVAVGVDGAMIVAFERNHRIWAYPAGEVKPRPLPAPDEISEAPENGGIEALTLLANGKLFAVAEELGNDDLSVGWVSDRSGWSVLTVRLSGYFKPTGATTLANGDVLLLERKFGLRSGIGSRIRRLDGKSITAGAVIDGEEIARFEGRVTFDNMEGIGSWVTPDGRQMVYVVSDDNYSALQRTYLMLFEMTGDTAR
jgi:hypothetical protein